LLFLTSEDIRQALPMKLSIECMRSAFSALSDGRADVPIRTHLSLSEGKGSALFMPVYLAETQKVAVKTVTVFKNNAQRAMPMIQALITVFDARDGRALAIMDGECLTALRTGAASGLATEILARQEAAVLAVFGAGAQARTQIEAVLTVRAVRKILIFDTDSVKARQLSAEISAQYKIEVIADNDQRKLQEADIICTATSSARPVFHNRYLKEGVHINGIGSYRPEMQEVPADTVARARIVVDSRQACLKEAGDLVRPIAQGKFSAAHIYAELGDIINAKLPGRQNAKEITFFKSVGNAVQDLVAADMVLQRAAEMGLGQKVDF